MSAPYPMIIYEVRVTADSSIAHEYWIWLQSHIRKILQEPGFIKAAIYRTSDLQLDPGTEWTIHYHLNSQKALDDYLNNRAEAYRAEGLKAFGDKFTAVRRVLEFTKEFT